MEGLVEGSMEDPVEGPMESLVKSLMKSPVESLSEVQILCVNRLDGIKQNRKTLDYGSANEARTV